MRGGRHRPSDPDRKGSGSQGIRIGGVEAPDRERVSWLFTIRRQGGPFGVTRIDGRILSNDRPGPLTNRLREAYWAKRKAGWHAEPVRYDLV
ncbi:hypothetical protein [Prosthecomicrobium hirschii]|uniref:hypothetical protein n=1 Tax=Prosthecodimorpha hirschii TaxID=665126 RepID=UPI00221E3C93|nr:hypothetical protein [Prosthecomicrobium hirschii]MCW1839604.1 hypothetical protein [Prosthecomicrobium hirschii]